MSNLKINMSAEQQWNFFPVTVFEMVIIALKILKQNNYIFININKTHKPQESKNKPELTSSAIKNI